MESNIDEQDVQNPSVDEDVNQSSNQDKSYNFGVFNEGTWIFASIGGYFAPAENLKNFSVSRQEQLLIRDLIYAFSGVPSTHIIPDITADQLASLTPQEMTKISFKIHDGFSSVFRPITKELMPLIGNYISVQSFIDETNMSMDCVSARKALASSMHRILEEYHDLQSNLDTELNEKKLDLQKLVQQIRPWLPIMLLFSNIATDVRRLSLNSAQVMSKLEDLYQVLKPTQNTQLAELVAKILQEITSGYMEMVQIWMQNGFSYDLLNEFFIEDTEPENAMTILLSLEPCWRTYWNQRYILHTDRLPNFLVKHAEIIFLAGKYLNILYQFNLPMDQMDTTITYNPINSNHVDVIRSSYELPAKRLMEVLLTDYNLLQEIHNIRSFALLQNITFANDLMENCRDYLKERIYNLQLNEMQMVFERVIQPLHESFLDYLHIQLKECDVTAQIAKIKRNNEEDWKESSDPAEFFNLYGFEAVAFRYEPIWPITLIISQFRSEQLEILQRILFFLRYVESQLIIFEDASLASIRSDNLLQTMLKTIRGLQQYMAKDVIETLWVDLLRAINQASNIDEVISAVNFALDQCMLQCLFSEVSFIRAIFTLGSVCLNYCDCLPNEDSESIEDLDRNVSEYEDNFEGILLCILNLIRELAKLDANTYENVESANKLLQRLENDDTDIESNTIIPFQFDPSTLD